jgi:hypothetical protein
MNYKKLSFSLDGEVEESSFQAVDIRLCPAVKASDNIAYSKGLLSQYPNSLETQMPHYTFILFS